MHLYIYIQHIHQYCILSHSNINEYAYTSYLDSQTKTREESHKLVRGIHCQRVPQSLQFCHMAILQLEFLER